MYSCLFWCEFIDLVEFFYCYCMTPVTLFIIRMFTSLGAFGKCKKLLAQQENLFVDNDWTRLFSSPPDSFYILNTLLRLKQHKIIIVSNLRFYRKTEKILSAIILPQIDKIPAFSSTDIIHWAADFFSSAMFVMFEQVRKKCPTKYFLSLFLFY